MIDLHTHILPGLDDGPETMEGSLALARAAVAAGTTVMAATPHVDHVWEVDPEDVAPLVGRVREALEDAGIALEVVAGAEVSLTRWQDLDPERRDLARLGDGPYVLLECPHDPIDPDFAERVFELRLRGEQILLAHPERCVLFQREPERLRQLADAGVLNAITAGSVTGTFGRTVRRVTIAILADGLAHALVSDAHDNRRRPPGLKTAIDEADAELPGIAAQVEWLVDPAPAAILSGAPFPQRPAGPPPQRRRRRWFGRGR
jgi:protein-tyrosine phosphatase